MWIYLVSYETRNNEGTALGYCNICEIIYSKEMFFIHLLWRWTHKFNWLGEAGLGSLITFSENYYASLFRYEGNSLITFIH